MSPAMDAAFHPSSRQSSLPQASAFAAQFGHSLLTIAFLSYIFIGTHPLASTSLAARADGDPLDRLVLLGLTGLALFVLLLHRRALPAIAIKGIGIWLIAGVAVLSMAWSNYPGLTLRRSIALACMVIIAAAVASGVRDIRRAHTGFCVFVSAIVVVNLLSVLAIPSVAISDIGVKGIYSQKNVAGTVAMIAVIANATWLAGGFLSKNRLLAGGAMLGVSVILLVLTQSKTSLGLTVLALFGAGGLVLIAKAGPRFALTGLLLAICGSIALLLLFAAHDFDVLSVLSLVLSDTSFTGRDEIWAFAAKAAVERPWGGHGYGAFWDVGVGGDPLLRVDPGTWLGDVEPGVINQAHNGYLELWLQIGLPAMVLATITVASLAIKGAYCWATAKGQKGTRAAIAFLTIMPLVALLHNLTEASFFLRGIILFDVLMPVLFLLARLDSFSVGHSRRSGDQFALR